MKQNTLVHLVLTLTVLTALAVSTTSASPSGQPPAANVSPNFSSLTVQNNAQISGKTITNEIEATVPANNVNIPRIKSLSIDTLSIKNTDSMPFGQVVIDDDLTVTQALNITSGKINMGNSLEPNTLKIDKGGLSNTSSDPSCNIFGGTCPIFAVNINDDLMVVEDTHLNGKLEIEKDVTSKGNINVIGQQINAQNISANGSVNVNGSIKANGKIGNFYYRTGSNTSAGNTNYAYAYCDSGDTRISCSAMTNTSYSGVYFLGASPSNSESCYASTWNTSGSSLTITTYAYCFSPNG